ncbi:MAG: transcriptional regulator [Acetatifactor sp.]|nr:transcriptional regulator [Acetatifactor sp.]
MRAYQFISVREKTGMNRKEFSEWLGIPYRTMQEWELERRTMPDYLLNLIEYKVDHEIKKKN